MNQMNLLQIRINELNSAIVNFVGNKVHITGFYNAKMLQSYLETGKDNHQSKGIYDKKEFSFNNVMNNSLFVIQENGIEQQRIQFEQISKETLKLNNSSKKEIVTIRKNKFSEHYLLRTEKSISSFENHDELNRFLQDKYQIELNFKE